jgi:chemotaxis protein MotB
VASLAALLAITACGPSTTAYQAALDQNQELLKRNQELLKRNDELIKHDQELAAARSAKSAEADRQARARLAEGQLRDAAQAARIASLRAFVESVRRSLGPRGIDVAIRNGRMLVYIPEAVLFDSGRANLKGDAKSVLDQMARLIKESGRSFLVTGYTDNVPIKNQRFQSNWELSTARAVAVVHHLLGQGDAPARLAAAGRADTEPVGDNTIARGRAMNRRIELVLEPDLAELPDLSPALRIAAAF